MAKITLILVSEDKESAMIRFRVRHNIPNSTKRIDLQVNPQIQIPLSFWDEKNKCLKRSVRQGMETQQEFARREKALYECQKNINFFSQLVIEHIKNLPNEDLFSLTTEKLNLLIDQHKHPKKYTETQNFQYPTKFLAFCKYWIDNEMNDFTDPETGKKLSQGTKKQYKNRYNNLKQYAEYCGQDDFGFDEINDDFHREYFSFLQDEQGKSVNTIGKEIKDIKTLVHKAPKELQDLSDLKSFKNIQEETTAIYLNEEELDLLWKCDLSSKPHLERCRDWFLILAWTGSRYSDSNKITKENIKDGFIHYYQQKVSVDVMIPIHKVVKEILEKYDYDLPHIISNQKFNKEIKEVGRIAGIDNDEQDKITKGGIVKINPIKKYEMISAHTARRSFATNLYKRNVPPKTIMSVTGHKTESSFYKYIRVTKEEHAQMIKDVWTK